MLPFPWDSLKAETLRSVCRDIGAKSATMRKRDDMVIFLKAVETRGLSSALQDRESSGKVVPVLAAKPPPVSNDTPTNPPTTSHDQREEGEEMSDQDNEEDSEEDSEEGTSDLPGSDGEAEPLCSGHCVDGWLSPRMKFILSTVAAVASDLVRDTGELAGELGHVGGVYMTHHMPWEELPQGKKAAALWVDGLSTIYSVIYKTFKAGIIPTEPALVEALGKIPHSDMKLVAAYTKHTELEHALSALVEQAKEEWEDEFQETHCDSKEWRKLPKCAEHDLDWTMVEDLLVG